MRHTILHGDCIEQMRTLPDNSVDAVVTDPPYELGFMGRSWDRSGIANSVEMWREMLRVLKPGGHLLAFGGTRTYHRMAVAIEDAGFEIRDCLQWLYGSGFPKSLDVSKAIDKAAGAEREVIGVSPTHTTKRMNGGAYNANQERDAIRELPITAPATPDAERWQGWGTATKPAYEPVIHAQKPQTIAGEWDIIVANLSRLEAQLWSLLPANIAVETFRSSQSEYDAACASARWTADERRNTLAGLFDQTDTSQFVPVMRTSLSIVQSWQRISADLYELASTSTTETATSLTTDLRTLNSCLSAVTPRCIIQAAMQADGSRWNALPAVRAFNAVESRLNSIHELSALASAIDAGHISRRDAIVAASPANEPIVLARKPLSERNVAANVARWGTGALNIDGCRIGTTKDVPASPRGPQDRIYGAYGAQDGTESGHDPNIGRWPANVILDECAAEMLDAQSGDLGTRRGGTYTHKARPDKVFFGQADKVERTTRDHAGAGGASRYFYVAKASRKERRGSTHPTVKPVALMRYLVRLITPPGGVVLDPFAGSGTTGEACVLEGFGCILIEREAEYIADIQARFRAVQPPLEMAAG